MESIRILLTSSMIILGILGFVIMIIGSILLGTSRRKHHHTGNNTSPNNWIDPSNG